MTDAASFWQLACEALAADDYEQAFALLHAGMLLSAPAEQGHFMLRAASLHALYGEAALSELRLSLSEAVRLTPALGADPLYLALRAELAVRERGVDVPDPVVPAQVQTAEDPLARFHALSAWVGAGRADAALGLALDLAELPPHLRWRAAALRAEAAEALGQTEQAAAFFEQAASGSQGPDRAVMLQELAALLTAQGELDRAEAQLTAARALYGPPESLVPQEALSLSTWHYLMAQLRLAQGQADNALDEIMAAARLEDRHGDPSYGVALVRGQALSALGRTEEALSAFGRAAALAQGPDVSYARHERAVALLDLDRPLEAREDLERIQADPAYPFQAEILADLAECDYRMGQLAQAQAGAEQALNLGAVVPASLVLGNVALEYYHLDDAAAHFERVVEASVPGSREWVLGHQLAADALAQQGFRDPAQVYAHAQQALDHTAESDEWYVTLQDHLARAAELMQAGGSRVLN